MIAYITEALLYLCYAVIVGTLMMKVIPETQRPTITVPWPVLLAAVLGIPILSFVPVYKITLFYQEAFQTDFWTIFYDVLFDVSVGTAWLWVLGFSAALLMILGLPVFREDKATPYVGLLLMLILIGWFGWGSHTKSLYEWPGFLTHTVHFLTVIVWIGLLMVTAWFSSSTSNWPRFLKWFSPLSIACVGAAIAAGFILSAYLAPEYMNSWMVPYGQALLIKHILIIPLLALAFVNGFVLPRRMKGNNSFNPIPWLKAESMIAFGTFIITAIMGQQDPPHDVRLFLKEAPPSSLFTSIYPGQFSPDMTISLGMHVTGIILAACSMILLLLIVRSKGKSSFTLIYSLLFTVSTYFSVMFSIR
ncbi:copper resistance D family protein [Paenibacillus sp. S-38]|uniref:copper resistance D family protein n=1 Tax=Paenibacillus sp. S-38 TaxID=3416710 RepID=UPI003CF0396F